MPEVRRTKSPQPCRSNASQIAAPRALPYDCVIDRLPGLPIPDHGRFALIAQAERRDFALVDAGFFDDVLCDAQGVLENLLRVVLYPTLFVNDLPMRSVGATEQHALFVKQQRLGALRGLVNAQYQFTHKLSHPDFRPGDSREPFSRRLRRSVRNNQKPPGRFR